MKAAVMRQEAIYKRGQALDNQDRQALQPTLDKPKVGHRSHSQGYLTDNQRWGNLQSDT